MKSKPVSVLVCQHSQDRLVDPVLKVTSDSLLVLLVIAMDVDPSMISVT